MPNPEQNKWEQEIELILPYATETEKSAVKTLISQTRQQTIEEEIEIAKKIVDAWLVAGPRPDIHREAKNKLRMEWPVLYYALEEFIRIKETK